MPTNILKEIHQNAVENVQYRYHAQTVDVVDGDTIDLKLLLYDGDQSVESTMRVRLAAVDTHEINVDKDSDEYEKGMEERQFVVEWLTEAAMNHSGRWPLTVATTEDETGKFGRTLAAIYRKSDGERLSDRLLDEFDGIAYEED